MVRKFQPMQNLDMSFGIRVSPNNITYNPIQLFIESHTTIHDRVFPCKRILNTTHVKEVAFVNTLLKEGASS